MDRTPLIDPPLPLLDASLQWPDRLHHQTPHLLILPSSSLHACRLKRPFAATSDGSSNLDSSLSAKPRWTELLAHCRCRYVRWANSKQGSPLLDAATVPSKSTTTIGSLGQESAEDPSFDVDRFHSRSSRMSIELPNASL